MKSWKLFCFLSVDKNIKRGPDIVNRKHFGSFALLLILLTTLIMLLLMTSLYGDGTSTYEYKPKRPKYAIANKAQYMDEAFYNQYVLTNELAYYNSIYYFTGLYHSTEAYNYTGNFGKNLKDFDPILGQLVEKKDLLVCMRASLAGCFPASQFALIQDSKGKDYINYTSSILTDGYTSFGDRNYVRIQDPYMKLCYGWYSDNGGFTLMKDPALVFADDVYPAVKTVSASREIDRDTCYNFGKGDKEVFIHVEYDEPIRFSDLNTTNHSNIYLKLKLVNLEGNEVTDPNMLKAELVRLEDRTITFRYSIPDKIGGADLNHCITGIEGIMDGSVNALNSNYPLRVMTYTGSLSGHWGPSGLISYTSPSLITDLAGNPVKSHVFSDFKKKIYLDTTTPEISKINLHVDKSKGGYVGPGAVITPEVTFSEPLYLKTETGIIPEPNPRSFNLFSNMKKVSGKVLFQGSYYKSDSNLVFRSFTVDENITMEGENDKIRTPRLASGYQDEGMVGYDVTDKVGNSLLDYSVIPEGLLADQFVLDTKGPTISFNTVEGNNKPVLYSSSGDEKIDCFYFPFKIQDNGSGILPIGEDATLEGSFQWDLGDSGFEKEELEKITLNYAVTNSADSPSQDDWESGAFNKEYAFKQIGNNKNSADLFLHFRLDGDATTVGLPLDGSTLIIKAEDAVGNKNNISFVLDGTELDKILDHTCPTITTDKLYSYAENGTWYFAVDFTFFDNSKIDTTSVYYAWMAGGSGPSQGDWKLLSGLGGNDKEVTTTVTYELDGNDLNERDLYIKVSDCSLNENESFGGPYIFKKDLRAPKVEVSVESGLSKKAVMEIKAQPQETEIQSGGSSETVFGKIIIRIKEESADHSTYSFRTINTVTDAVYEDIDIDNVFDDISKWVIKGDNARDIIDGSFYGEIEAEVVTGYGITCDGYGEIKNLKDSVLSAESYSFSLAAEKDEIHEISIESSFKVKENWESPGDGPKYLTTLSGVNFSVSISNKLMPGWGAKDIDLGNSYFELYKDGDSEAIFKAPLSMSSTITLPTDITYDPGNYKVKAVAISKTFGHKDNQVMSGLIVDTTVPGEYGLSEIATKFTPKENSNAGMLCEKMKEKFSLDPVHYEHEVDEETVYEKSPYILMGFGENDFVKIIKEFHFSTISENDEFYIKVWNATEGIDESESKDKATWTEIGTPYEPIFVDSAEEVLSAYDAGNIPLIKDKENIIHYQVSHANGNKSGESVLIIDTSGETPEITVSLSPDESIPSQEVTALVTNLSGSSSNGLTAYYFDGDESSSIEEATDEIELLKKDRNWFFTNNDYDNYNILDVKAPHLDKTPPSIVSKNVIDETEGEGDGYAFNIIIEDENKCNVYLKFDDDYMGRLGLTEYFSIVIPEDESETWLSDTPSINGIYKVEKEDIDEGISLRIYGVYKYDKDNPGPKNIGISIRAVDEAYNSSEEKSITLNNVKNTIPKATTISAGTVWEWVPYYDSRNPGKTEKEFPLYCVSADFNLPVNNITPLPYHNVNNGYTTKKDFLSIFKDGDYTISYSDVFGERYNEDKSIAIDHNNIRYENMNITIYGENEAGKYSVYVEPVANEGKDFIFANEGPRFSIFADKYQESIFDGNYIRRLTDTKASVEMNFYEDTIIVMMKYNVGLGGWQLDSLRPLIIIDGSERRAPSPIVKWYYHEFASNGVPQGMTDTDGAVDVWLSSTVPLTGLNGKLLNHTFIYGEDDSYTFEYEYDDGVIGERTVTLPIPIIEEREKQSMDDLYEHNEDSEIDEEDLIPKDNNPPAAIFEVNRGYGNKLKDKGYWNPDPELNEDLGTLLSPAGYYSLNVKVIDESKTKMIILDGDNASVQGITYENAANDTVDGVTISGTTIKVAAAAPFTVFIIDESNNSVSYSFPSNLWEKLDNEMPCLDEIDYKRVDFLTVDAHFSLKDDKTPTDDIELLSPTGLIKKEGKYTLTFTENKSVEITMRDLAGNIGSGTVSVNTIDDKPPIIELSWWSKGYFNETENTIDPKRLTTEKTNQTITAKLITDKPIKEIAIKELKDTDTDTSVDEDHKDEYILLENEPDGIYVSFLKNAYVSLDCTAVNGKVENIPLEVKDIIDREPPTYDCILVDDSPEKIEATVTFSDLAKMSMSRAPARQAAT